MPKTIGNLELYDVDELGEKLGVHTRTIRVMLKEGKLKGRKLARRWYCTEEAIREYFSHSEAEAGHQEQK